MRRLKYSLKYLWFITLSYPSINIMKVMMEFTAVKQQSLKTCNKAVDN